MVELIDARPLNVPSELDVDALIVVDGAVVEVPEPHPGRNAHQRNDGNHLPVAGDKRADVVAVELAFAPEAA
jgi:hypothetical protein